MLLAASLLQMGVFAVILQQLNCSLGYVYVSYAVFLIASVLFCFLLQSSHAGGLSAGACTALLGASALHGFFAVSLAILCSPLWC